MKSPTLTYLESALQALRQLVHHRLHLYFQREGTPPAWPKLPEAVLEDDALSRYVRHYELRSTEQWLILIALAPHLEAGFYDRIVSNYLPKGGDFPEFGGRKSPTYRSFLPTGETAVFLLGGITSRDRFAAMGLLHQETPLFRNGLLSLSRAVNGEPRLSGLLEIDAEFLEVFITGRVSPPRLSPEFPAQQLSTEQDWSELILDGHTRGQLRDLENWLLHRGTLNEEWGLGPRLRPGYRSLFFGPPGTGKTLTANLLGRKTDRAVFRIDLSMVVSKYIGETEKNLAQLFDKAEHKDWILFFDEADALFGKRTGTRTSNDKHANQEVAYLLQRIEGYAGLTILASNFKSNIDEAFLRRFDSIVYFPPPKVEERELLWQKALPEVVNAEAIDWPQTAKQYALTGGQIINIVRYCCLELIRRKSHKLTEALLLDGIRRELQKEGK